MAMFLDWHWSDVAAIRFEQLKLPPLPPSWPSPEPQPSSSLCWRFVLPPPGWLFWLALLDWSPLLINATLAWTATLVDLHWSSVAATTLLQLAFPPLSPPLWPSR